MSVVPITNDVLISCQDGTFGIWKWIKGESRIAKKDSFESWCHCCNSPTLHFVGGSDGIWSQFAGVVPPIEKKLDCGITGLLFSDKETILSAGDDGKIRAWTSALNEFSSWQAHKQGITAMLLNKSNKQLITRDYSGSVKVWDWAKEKMLREFDIPVGDSDALVLSPDGKTLAGAGRNHIIRFWNAETGKELNKLSGPHGQVTSVDVSPTGDILAFADFSGLVHLYNLPGYNEQAILSGHGTGMVQITFSDNNKWLASHMGSDDVRIWDFRKGELVKKLKSPKGDEVLAVAFAPNSYILVVSYRRGGIRFWDVETNKIVRTTAVNGGAAALVFTPDGKTLAYAGEDKIVLVDVKLDQNRKEWKTQSPAVSLAYSPTGVLASGHYDGIIRIWADEKVEFPQVMEGHLSAVYDLSFSPSGYNLASASFDRTVRLWEVVTTEEVGKWKGHQGAILAVVLANHGRDLISASSDTTLLSWDITGRQENGKIAERKLANADTLWSRITSLRTSLAHDAVWDLIASDKESIAYLREKLNPMERKKIDRYIQDLGSKKFAVRTKANKALLDSNGTLGLRVCLSEARKAATTLETRLRLEKLLNMMTGPGGLSIEQERILLARVMEVCEQSRTKEAINLLVDLDKSALGAELAAQARMALERVKK